MKYLTFFNVNLQNDIARKHATYSTFHCAKSVQIRGYFWSVFSRIQFYFVSLRIQFKCGKIQTRNNSVFGHFSRSVCNFKKIQMNKIMSIATLVRSSGLPTLCHTLAKSKVHVCGLDSRSVNFSVWLGD